MEGGRGMVPRKDISMTHLSRPPCPLTPQRRIQRGEKIPPPVHNPYGRCSRDREDRHLAAKRRRQHDATDSPAMPPTILPEIGPPSMTRPTIHKERERTVRGARTERERCPRD
uniref:Uncharacterized protein n=1 Tax=Ananas comosus var. bracteatus TaxID=296719 RepID=A0A6V7PRS3_ANACO|nr:unnamed protein product [Ananas comosus var. bracteatus]